MKAKTAKQKIDEARQMGQDAFKSGKSRAPAANEELMAKVYEEEHKTRIGMMKAYLNGWDFENLYGEDQDD